MKKLVVTILTLLTCGAAYALPVGNPTEASLFLNGAWMDNNSCCDPCDPCFSWADSLSFRLGYYGDFVFSRHLKKRGEEGSGTGGHIRDGEIFTNAGYLALNFCNRFDIFTTLGASDMRIRTNGVSFAAINQLIELDFRERFSWSVGARATLWECNCFGIGLEGQYFQFKPELDHYINYNTGAFTYFNGSQRHQRYHEWQVGLGASYRFATSCPTVAFVPYTAVKWSRARHNMRNFTFTDDLGTLFTLHDLRSAKHWGWALGITMELCDMIGVTVEGRWADENALYVNGQFRF